MTNNLITPAADTPGTGDTTSFDEALAALDQILASPLLVSQDRCVDGLLDLYNSATSDLIRQLIVNILDDIRHLHSVRTAYVTARLSEVTAAMAVEVAFCS
jgi:hypothetical protein